MGRPYAQELVLYSGVGAVTADGDSGDLTFTPDDAVFTLDISGATGTSPTIDVTIEEKDSLSGKYTVIDTFPQQTGIAKVRRTLAGPFGSTLRAVWVVGGTSPVFTLTLSIQGKQAT